MKKLIAVVLVFVLASLCCPAAADDIQAFIILFNVSSSAITGAPELTRGNYIEYTMPDGKQGRIFEAGNAKVIIANDRSSAIVIAEEKDIGQLLQLSASVYFTLLEYANKNAFEYYDTFYYVLLTDYFTASAGKEVKSFDPPGLLSCFLVKSESGEYVFYLTVE